MFVLLAFGALIIFGVIFGENAYYAMQERFQLFLDTIPSGQGRVAILLLFGGMGVGLLAKGIIGLYHTHGLLQNCVETTGVIIRVEESYHSSPEDSGWSYYRVVKFVDSKTGNEFTVRDRVGTTSLSARGFVVGGEIDVIYDPENPENARIETFWNKWGHDIMFVFFGCFCLSFPLFILISVLAS